MKNTFRLLTYIAMLCFAINGKAQQIYDEKADVNQQLDQAISTAKTQNKYVFAMVGGNWCRWCKMFNEKITTNDSISVPLNRDFVTVHLNWPAKQGNPKIVKRLGKVQRFGFPVFVILNQKGEVLHVQNSAYLEQGEGYSTKAIIDFLSAWSKKSVE